MAGLLSHQGLLLKPSAAAPIVGYFNNLMADIPSLYWRLGETGAVTVATDISGNARHGTYRRNASSDTVAGLLVTGADADPAINIPSVALVPTQGVQIAANPVLNSGSWTFSVLIKVPAIPAPSGGVGSIFQIGGATSCPEVDVIDNGGGTYKLRVMLSGASILFTTASSWAYGTKAHVLLRRRGTNTIELYVNGTLAGSGTNSYANASGAVRVGYASFTGTDGYSVCGNIDEFVMYNYALSDARVAAHYANI